MLPDGVVGPQKSVYDMSWALSEEVFTSATAHPIIELIITL